MTMLLGLLAGMLVGVYIVYSTQNMGEYRIKARTTALISYICGVLVTLLTFK